jgi:hypothetical protein
MAINRGQKPSEPSIDQTPAVNGFKLIKATPIHNQVATTYSKKP